MIQSMMHVTLPITQCNHSKIINASNTKQPLTVARVISNIPTVRTVFPWTPKQVSP